jgi:hypothetical protein
LALMDVNPEFVIQACKRIRSYLEEIRTSIESNAQGPVITLDFDALGQLLMPHKRSSNQAGLLWHGVMTARQLRIDQSNTKGGRSYVPAPQMQRIQIPEGAKRELTHFCKKLLREYKDVVQGPAAQKLGVEPEDLEHFLSDKALSDDELSWVARKFGSVNLSLKLLDSLLEMDIEFSRLNARQLPDIRFHDYLARLEMLRPEPNKSLNNRNDALNLAETSDLRSRGREAYLVTTTKAVIDSEDRLTREPFYFAFGLAVRKRFHTLPKEAVTMQLDLMISRLTHVIRHTTEYGHLVSTSMLGDQSHLQKEITFLRRALSELGDDAALTQLTDLLADAASAVRSGSDSSEDALSTGKANDDIVTFSKFRSMVKRLQEKLGDVPKVTIQRKRLTSQHLSYSFLDQQGNLSIAADLYKDELAVAWATELNILEFCSDVVAYYADISQPAEVKVLIRFASVIQPRIFEVASLPALTKKIECEIGDNKASLIKVMCDEDIFWYDASLLYAFDFPEETLEFQAAQIAVSIQHKGQLSQLVKFFRATSVESLAPTDARNTLKRLLKMEDN